MKKFERLSQKLERVEITIIELKEEKIIEVLIEILWNKDKDYEKRKEKIVALRKHLDKANNQLQMKFEKSTKMLDQIIERPSHIKTNIGFIEDKKARM